MNNTASSTAFWSRGDTAGIGRWAGPPSLRYRMASHTDTQHGSLQCMATHMMAWWRIWHSRNVGPAVAREARGPRDAGGVPNSQ